MYSLRIGRALELAAVSHEGQYRKDPTRRIPYIAHPVAVALLLTKHGFPEDVVIGGLLHDTLEDTSLTVSTLREHFGDTVAALVVETSEADRSLPWEQRKLAFLERLRGASLWAKAISCCDKLHNMQSLAAALGAGCDMWSVLSRDKPAQVAIYARALPIYRDALKADLVGEYAEVLELLRTL